MNIHEYQAKKLLKDFDLPAITGNVGYSKDELMQIIDSLNMENGYVVKAQIHAGGRGKAGGVKLFKDANEAKDFISQIYGKPLITHQTGPDGQVVSRIAIEPAVKIEKEYYISCILDRSNSCVTFIASKEGGVDIEEVASETPEKIVKVCVDFVTGVQPFHCRRIASALALDKNLSKQMFKIVKSLYEFAIKKDAMQLEINPLVLSEDKLLILDAKVDFDENAIFRQPMLNSLIDESEEDPLELRAKKKDLSYIRLDGGNIGCMVNGAGLAMATMDIIKLYGGKPANFLDVGGGADKERVAEALKIIISDKSVKAILVNIFGGIMRCDIIAKGIVAATKEVGLDLPLVVRLAGTNFELGREILNNSGLKIIAASNLADATDKIVSTIN